MLRCTIPRTGHAYAASNTRVVRPATAVTPATWLAPSHRLKSIIPRSMRVARQLVAPATLCRIDTSSHESRVASEERSSTSLALVSESIEIKPLACGDAARMGGLRRLGEAHTSPASRRFRQCESMAGKAKNTKQREVTYAHPLEKSVFEWLGNDSSRCTPFPSQRERARAALSTPFDNRDRL